MKIHDAKLCSSPGDWLDSDRGEVRTQYRSNPYPFQTYGCIGHQVTTSDHADHGSSGGERASVTARALAGHDALFQRCTRDAVLKDTTLQHSRKEVLESSCEAFEFGLETQYMPRLWEI